MATFKAAYLICGDDHGRIGERRAKLRELAEAASGADGLELLDGDRGTPDAVAATLSAMTLTLSHRFIIVDGVERWKDKELDGLEAALKAIAPETTVAFFAREDGRAKAPERLHKAVKAIKGDIAAENAVKPWELPKWVVARGAELGLELEPDAARALVTHVGERQQRLLRELEKLALGAESDPAHPRTPISAEQVGELTASSADRRAWTVADALIAGEGALAVRSFLELRQQGERVSGLLYMISQRVRIAHDVAVALEAGQAPAQVKRSLRMPSRAADRLIEDARRSGAQQLQQAICAVADLELASRGGGHGVANEDTAAVRAIVALAA